MKSCLLIHYSELINKTLDLNILKISKIIGVIMTNKSPLISEEELGRLTPIQEETLGRAKRISGSFEWSDGDDFPWNDWGDWNDYTDIGSEY